MDKYCILYIYIYIPSTGPSSKTVYADEITLYK